MLPRKLHIAQINRFHDTVEKLSQQIKDEKDEKIKDDLCLKYFKLTDKLWVKIDDFTDEIGYKIDKILNINEQ